MFQVAKRTTLIRFAARFITLENLRSKILILMETCKQQNAKKNPKTKYLLLRT